MIGTVACRRGRGVPVCLGVTALAVLPGLWFWQPAAASHPGPRSLDEAVAIAARAGFCCRGDTETGVPDGRLVISELPLTWQRANGVRLSDPYHPCWAGTVAVYARRGSFNQANFDPARAARWGNLFVYGDPVVIQQLRDAD
jgi:hypothetical protein